MTLLSLSKITLDPALQPRAAIDETVVAEYAEAMVEGATFPPVVVFLDGATYWLADGYHRYHAARLAVLIDLEADIRTGTKRDAILHAAGVNADHGLRRTNADKRRAVATLIMDSEWSKWSDREIARRCSVSRDLVGEARAVLTVGSDSDTAPTTRTYTDRHGTTTTMDTSNIGRRQPIPLPPPPPSPPGMSPAPPPAFVLDTPPTPWVPPQREPTVDEEVDEVEPAHRAVVEAKRKALPPSPEEQERLAAYSRVELLIKATSGYGAVATAEQREYTAQLLFDAAAFHSHPAHQHVDHDRVLRELREMGRGLVTLFDEYSKEQN